MSDEVTESPRSARPSRSSLRERALRETRERLRRLEIETHRIKADLARLEAENETDIADELTEELQLAGVAVGADSGAVSLEWSPTPQRTSQPQPAARRRNPTPVRPADQSAALAPTILVPAKVPTNGDRSAAKSAGKRRKKLSRAWLASLGAHAMVLLLLAPMTYVMLTNEQPTLFASMFSAEATDVDELGATPIELVSFEEESLPADVTDAPPSLATNMTEEFGLLDSQLENATAAENVGQLNTLPTDVGTLMAGGGAGDATKGGTRGGGRGAAGDEARLGRTSFFGTPARANRVVFLVDNSASMKQGRMETTLFELARSVEQLGEKQEFYVVFYSDQAYPMMYPASEMKPLRATRENKQRLYQWLQTVELCVGGALLKAVDLAESLEPEVVYLLSDGDITGTATMERLSQTSDRRFPIHTLGMGVKKPQDAQNLSLIAQANRGTFQMVGTMPAAVQMAKARPIRSNPWKVAWGQGNFAAGR